MTIKKTIKVKPTGSPKAAASAAGGAAIADRFKLDAPDPSARKAASGPATTCAATAGLIALAVAGLLTVILYKHWEYLMPW